MNFEKQKLKTLGVNNRPIRVSIDDEAGYIESWDKRMEI